MIRVLYPCDPSKNTKCTKESCGDLCTLTTDPTVAKENWLFKELRIIKEGEVTSEDALFIKILEAEGKSHECKR